MLRLLDLPDCRQSELQFSGCSSPSQYGTTNQNPQFERNTVQCLAESVSCDAGAHDSQKSEAVVLEQAARIYRVAFRMVGNQADAEDITQDVILQVIRQYNSFRGESAITTWIYRITVNAALALQRRRGVARERHAGDSWDLTFDTLSTGHRTRVYPASPESELLERELRDAIESAIQQLPDAYRAAFVLSDIEGVPKSELADILGLSLPAAKSRLHRARLMLRQLLGSYVDGQ